MDVSGAAAAIDANAVGFFLDGWFGGFKDQDDNALLTATFVDSNGTTLGSVSIGGVLAADRDDVMEMLERSTCGALPVGTRTIELLQTMTRYVGDYNDGYADNLALVLFTYPVQSPKPVTASINRVCSVQLFSLLDGPAAAILIPSVTNEIYQLQYSNSMTPTNWLNTGGSITSLGGPLPLVDEMVITLPTQRFYRAVITP